MKLNQSAFFEISRIFKKSVVIVSRTQFCSAAQKLAFFNFDLVLLGAVQQNIQHCSHSPFSKSVLKNLTNHNLDQFQFIFYILLCGLKLRQLFVVLSSDIGVDFSVRWRKLVNKSPIISLHSFNAKAV